MTRTNDIIAMARRAGAHDDGNEVRFVELRYLERFVALVRADEREVCAKLIESRKTGANELMDAVRDMEARAIRARGQT
jgi:hypothetical protein